jgi:hypothetical protein
MVLTGLEGPVASAVMQAAQKLFGTAKSRRYQQQVRKSTRTLVPTTVAQGLLAELTAAEVRRLKDYLASPDFEEIALQFVLGRQLKGKRATELKGHIREELRQGLCTMVELPAELLVTATDTVFDALTAGASQQTDWSDSDMAATAAHLTAAAAANSQLLRQVGDLAHCHEFADQLRTQVAAVHGHMRLPHLGVSRSVPYGQLYVEPLLRPEQEQSWVPDLTELALPGRRSVILGDPGAGKSTLAAKLAHDLASNLVDGAESRVPFLLVLRNFAGSFRAGGKSLAYYLEQVCRDPYNLDPPLNAVDYLLRNGRAMVLLDGLDELVEPDLRLKFIDLVAGFISRYPLVPIVVTARRIGYSEAPLDRRLFTVGIVADLNEDQVKEYAERWFALDASTAEGERPRMAASFLAESEGITELRANPLLLALLCAMYSSEHYIPHNLAQIYEKCALMLFERWDSMRGIPMPMQFRGRLRTAVQHLAWYLFIARESGKALPRRHIVKLLVDHLATKQFDEDEAIEAAEQFVEFCTGRSWILTDVGATGTEPRYGFTHRTFMEYFAAEHLARNNHTPRQLWSVLRLRVLAGEWEVVAQIALQLLDRNVEDGVDELLRLVLAEEHADIHERSLLHCFLARSLGYLHPSHDVIAEVTTRVLYSCLEEDIRDRFHYRIESRAYEHMNDLDEALYTLMYQCSPGNLPVVRRTVAAKLRELLDYGSETAMYATINLSRHLSDHSGETAVVWWEVSEGLQTDRASIIANWHDRMPWSAISRGVEPDQLVSRFGPYTIYLEDTFLCGSLPCVVERILREMGSGITSSGLLKLCDALLRAARPWISDDRWWRETSLSASEPFSGYSRASVTPRARIAPFVLLYLPYLEARAHKLLMVELPESEAILHKLCISRAEGKPTSDLRRELRNPAFGDDVRAFLLAWVRQEFDVLGPRPGIS